MRDVAIIGGGPSGLAAAIALAERGINTLVVDPHGGMSAERGELLAHAAVEIVARLGLSQVLDQALQIDHIVSHWGRARMQSHAGVPALGFYGWGINRQSLSRAMLNRVKEMGVPLQRDRAISFKRNSSGWKLNFTDGSSLQARFLIDATGRPGAVARRQGAKIWQDTDLVALIWSTSRSKGPAFMQAEAVPDGWWYAVPYGQAQTIGFVTSAQHAKDINSDLQSFLHTPRNMTRLIDLKGLGPLQRMMDCRSAVLEEMSGSEWIAAGDAAAAFDPISSQGLFNAFSSGFFAANAAADTLAGDPDAPRVYAALAARTADRTHSMTRLQYAALPFETGFWRDRSMALPDSAPISQGEAQIS